MATYNSNLENLNLEEIKAVSERYLMGWQDLMGEGYGFRVKGLNRRRQEYGLEPLTKEWSNQYRIDYIRSHFTQDEINSTISEYLQSSRVDSERWAGIFLFGCRFGREYATIFRSLMGSAAYRKASEDARVSKLVETQESRYGGVGLRGAATKKKAMDTVLERYGVVNVMHSDAMRPESPFCQEEVRQKSGFTKWQYAQKAVKSICPGTMLQKLLKSKAETMAYLLLSERFGKQDVFYEYGIHPSDKRYPHNCDFYIKSQDLFIELHCHYSHGNHWFDSADKDDLLRLSHLMGSDSRKSREAARVWTKTDVLKRADAKRSGIKYLVFWDGTVSPKAAGSFPNLSDFYKWFYEYDCDYEQFVEDHPENTC